MKQHFWANVCLLVSLYVCACVNVNLFLFVNRIKEWKTLEMDTENQTE